MSEPIFVLSISCTCRVLRDVGGHVHRQWHPDCEMHGNSPEAAAARERLREAQDRATAPDRIARALALVEEIRARSRYEEITRADLDELARVLDPARAEPEQIDEPCAPDCLTRQPLPPGKVGAVCTCGAADRGGKGGGR